MVTGENREDIVLKRLDAPYIPGKPNRGGPQLKFKFVARVSVVNAQRRVEVSLFKDGVWFRAGM